MKQRIICAARHPSDNTVILLTRGEMGYSPFKEIDVEAFNERAGISPDQAEAMLVGSMFGWDVPGAAPAWEIGQ